MTTSIIPSHVRFAAAPLQGHERLILTALQAGPIVIARSDESDHLDLLILLTAMCLDGLVESEYSAERSTFQITGLGRAGLAAPPCQ